MVSNRQAVEPQPLRKHGEFGERHRILIVVNVVPHAELDPITGHRISIPIYIYSYIWYFTPAVCVFAGSFGSVHHTNTQGRVANG